MVKLLAVKLILLIVVTGILTDEVVTGIADEAVTWIFVDRGILSIIAGDVEMLAVEDIGVGVDNTLLSASNPKSNSSIP